MNIANWRRKRKQQQSMCMLAAGHHWLEYFKWAAIAAVVIGLPTILLRAFAGLRRLLLDINILMTVAVAGMCLWVAACDSV